MGRQRGTSRKSGAKCGASFLQKTCLRQYDPSAGRIMPMIEMAAVADLHFPFLHHMKKEKS
jgi:hypothetical protein